MLDCVSKRPRLSFANRMRMGEHRVPAAPALSWTSFGGRGVPLCEDSPPTLSRERDWPLLAPPPSDTIRIWTALEGFPLIASRNRPLGKETEHRQTSVHDGISPSESTDPSHIWILITRQKREQCLCEDRPAIFPGCAVSHVQMARLYHCIA
jgi:hypothetical protein